MFKQIKAQNKFSNRLPQKWVWFLKWDTDLFKKVLFQCFWFVDCDGSARICCRWTCASMSPWMGWVPTPTLKQMVPSTILVTALARTWVWLTTSSRSPLHRKVIHPVNINTNDCCFIDFISIKVRETQMFYDLQVRYFWVMDILVHGVCLCGLIDLKIDEAKAQK